MEVSFTPSTLIPRDEEPGLPENNKTNKNFNTDLTEQVDNVNVINAAPGSSGQNNGSSRQSPYAPVKETWKGRLISQGESVTLQAQAQDRESEMVKRNRKHNNIQDQRIDIARGRK